MSSYKVRQNFNGEYVQGAWYTVPDAMVAAQVHANRTNLVHEVVPNSSVTKIIMGRAYPNAIEHLRHKIDEVRKFAKWLAMQDEPGTPPRDEMRGHDNPMREVVQQLDVAEWWIDRTTQDKINPYARSDK